MSKKILLMLVFCFATLIMPQSSYAAGVISPSGGGTVTVGQTFTIKVIAAGADFDTLQGVISITGPVAVSSFTAGSATWLPGKTPSNGTQFVGMTSTANSLLVATIKLKATAVGSGTVSVTGARMALAGAQVGDGGGSAGFTVIASTSKTTPSVATTPTTEASATTPEPAIDEKLAKPSEITISKSDKFSADFENGTVTGLIISGVVPSSFFANLFFSPELILPKDVVLYQQSGADGKFTYNIDFPVKTGFYKLQVQGRKDLVLTPKSDEIKFEISSAGDGSLSVVGASEKKKEFDWSQIYYLIGGVIVLVGAISVLIIRKRKARLPTAIDESIEQIAPVVPISSPISETPADQVSSEEINQPNEPDSINLPK